MMSRLGTFLSLLTWEFRLQRRYYFWTAALVITLVWLALLASLSEGVNIQWIPVLIFADICSIALLFIAGILYLERHQGTLYAAVVTPVTTGMWLGLKILGLALLCTVCSLVIVWLNVESVSWWRVLTAVLLSAGLFASCGFLLACPFEKILNYFFVMAMAMAFLNLPILAYFEIFGHPLFWLIPSQGAMWLLKGSLQEMSAISFYGVALLVGLWIMVLHRACVYLLTNSVSQN